ncbi:hypothetical protein C8J57DRAFT_1368779 [Mycena rebaudengoi]|nr:hypothetical protein C8J57DRAFT_1368779 [Mycena rebaudengoi]
MLLPCVTPRAHLPLSISCLSLPFLGLHLCLVPVTCLCPVALIVPTHLHIPSHIFRHSKLCTCTLLSTTDIPSSLRMYCISSWVIKTIHRRTG